VILSIENRDLKLKPGMTANISITVDKRDNVLKVPNASFRYLPPNTTPPTIDGPEPAANTGGRAPSETNGGSTDRVSLPLAPGQKWNPSDKIHFKAPTHATPKSTVLWVLGPDNKPLSRTVSVGLTDGSMTEILSGELKEGEQVIVSDSTQASSSSQQGFSLFGGNRGR